MNNFENDHNSISNVNINIEGDKIYEPENFEKLAGGGLNSSDSEMALDSKQGSEADVFQNQQKGIKNSTLYNQVVEPSINLNKDLHNIPKKIKRKRDEVREILDLDNENFHVKLTDGGGADFK